MSSGKTIVILGGGIGGIVAARETRKYLDASHRIIIIDRQPVFSFAPSFLWVMIGWRMPEVIQKSLTLLERYGIEFLQGVVEEISVGNKTIRTSHGVIAYDYLVIALGSELMTQQIPGLQRSAGTFYSLPGAIEIYQRLKHNPPRRIAIVVSSLPYKCPPAPYEAAFLLESYFSRSGREMKIEIFTPESSPLAVAGPDTGAHLTSLLKNRGISLRANKVLQSISEDGNGMTFTDGSSAETDLVIAIPPHRIPEVVRQANLSDASGWIPVDAKTLRTGYPDVFAIGDVTSIPLQNGMFLPKVGVIAADQGDVVATSIAWEIIRHPPRKEFTGAGFCFIETGNGRAAYLSTEFYNPAVSLATFHEPNVTYHWGKVVFEKYWLWRWF